MEEIAWIRERRRKAGLTQHQLARLSGVSQSLVAKVESGGVDASYSKVRAILSALENQSASKEKAAREIMHPGVETVLAGDTLHAAAQKMRKNGISQLPVEDNHLMVGALSEEQIVSIYSTDPKKMSSLRVSEVMADAFPTASPTTPISAIAALLRHHPAVLVMDKGKIAGIITKADLLKTI